MYIRVVDNKPETYSVGRLRNDNPLVSFPREIPDATLAEYGVYRVTPSDPPTYDPLKQKLVKADPVEVNGKWTQQWEVIDYTAEEIAAQQRQRDIEETTDPEKLTNALEVLTRKLVDTATLDSLDDDDLAKVGTLFRAWTVDGVYVAQEIRKHNGKLWVCEQGHNGQIDREPGAVPALWSPYRDPAGSTPRWQMLTPPDTWDTGDEVIWDNPNDGGADWLYRSKIDANTTEPGRDSTFDRYWEPVGPA
jgi:hypothetical protein